MKNLRKENATAGRELVAWFAALVVTGPIHMAEQMMSGLDVLYELKGVAAGYYSQFNNADVGTVTLVIAIVTFVQLLVLGVLAGGRWRLAVAGFFGFAGIGEAHHIIQSLWFQAYFPGVISSLAYVWIGAVLLQLVAREWKSAAPQAAVQAAVA